MKPILCCLALLCLFNSTSAQTSISKSNGLAIGSLVPDVALHHVMNHPSGKVNLSDYRGQLLILDFWATWCSPCIASLPKTDSINKAFRGKAMILPITYQSKEDVAKLFAKVSYLRNIAIPIATSEQELHKLFPHSEIPHYIWIDPQGKVVAITGYKEVTSANITKMLASSPIALKQKDDQVILPYDRSVPLIYNKVDIVPEDMLFQSLLVKYKDGFASRIDVLAYPDNTIARLTATNTDLRNLYAYAFSSIKEKFTTARIILEVRDTTRLVYPDADKVGEEAVRTWQKRNTYCYELLVPPAISKDFFTTMQQELSRIFPQYIATIEKRKTKVLALVRTSGDDKIKSRGEAAFSDFGIAEVVLTGRNLNMLVAHWNYTLQLLKVPVIDQTGYTGKVDLVLKCSQSNLENIGKALQAYDLALVYKTIPVDMLVIKDAH
jgi:thiol-disulfide isomerase/thioredoxin